MYEHVSWKCQLGQCLKKIIKRQLGIFRYNDMALRNCEILWISGFALFTNAT